MAAGEIVRLLKLLASIGAAGLLATGMPMLRVYERSANSPCCKTFLSAWALVARKIRQPVKNREKVRVIVCVYDNFKKE